MNAQVGVQLEGYCQSFNQCKVLRMVREYWLNDNDEIVKQDQVMTEMYTVYDAEAQNRRVDNANINKFPGVKMVIMKPFERYRLSLVPKWKLTNATANTPSLWNFTGYFDSLSIRTGSQFNGYSPNAHHVSFVTNGTTSEPTAFFYRDTYYLHFKNREQNVVYLA